MKKDQSLPASGDLSLLTGGNAPFLDDLYQAFLTDPASVTDEWRDVFTRFEASGELPAAKSPQFFSPQVSASNASPSDCSQPLEKTIGVLKLIEAYRNRAHLVADLDPLGLNKKPDVPDLTLAYNNLSEADLDTVFLTGNSAAGDSLTLRQVLEVMKDAYAGPIGIEYSHITNAEELKWLQRRLEGIPSRPHADPKVRATILEKLTMAEGMEKYLHTKYVGQKRFSLEGGDSLIPLLNDLIQHSGSLGAKEIILGMAHRGRLNVLVNILGKSPAELFGEFEGKNAVNHSGSGDVKYHMGFSSDIMTPGGPLHLALGFNPSHLEIINPVVEGSVRARQERRNDVEQRQVIPILIHGDAAFAGQGVVMETIAMAQTRGYRTGGTVHIIINNQVGFTTSNLMDARSTLYCTEVAKLVQSPIIHVNGDDPDAVIYASQLALEFRMEFKRDVVIDMICYRRHGHNEADEPMVTQPLMYTKIRSMPTTREIYAKRLVDEGVISADEPQRMIDAYRSALDEGRVVAGQLIDPNKVDLMIDWTKYLSAKWTDQADTTITLEKLTAYNEKLHELPGEFPLHRQVQNLMDNRNKMAAGELPMDWGFAETMAYASLLDEGFNVRLSGQDSGRGTFFHRHAVLHHQETGETFMPLSHMATRPYQLAVINSFLSEEAVLGFEYGYSTTEPTTLTIWEGQFGDFVNGAQVVIDQFISSGEEKWQRLSGLTLLLPHGYEGQGPEHSSARLERFLQLCANHNMQVCVPSTPAQMFHMLRRQIIRPLRRPLIVMSPKSLLRHKLSVSSLEDLTHGHFHNVIQDTTGLDANNVKRVVFCSGKVYFDLYQKRQDLELFDTAIVRVEQLHPFPVDELELSLAQFPNANDFVWCQEEPLNQGAWYQIRHHLHNMIDHNGNKIRYAGREASASPASGFNSVHVKQQQQLVEQAFNLI